MMLSINVWMTTQRLIAVIIDGDHQDSDKNGPQGISQSTLKSAIGR